MNDMMVIPASSSTGLMPVMSVPQAVERYNVLVEFTKSVMVKDQDFGVIPGVSKPCLYKAGAEKLLSLFGFSPSFSIIERTEDWIGKDHGGEPFFYYFYKCQLLRGGEILGEGDGSCNSWEKKYRYRSGERKCPKCGKPAIIVGKAEYGGGFICFAKKNGCGAKFRSDDATITGQDTGLVANPDIAEQVNTLQKMAQKRALVAAVLIACNASAFFTQDVEDMQTIDVTPSETRDEVVERRLAEERSKVPPDNGYEKRHAAMVTELADFLDTPPDMPPAAEAPAKPKATRKRGTIKFEALAAYKEIKNALKEVTGTNQTYYDILKLSGVEHADGLNAEQSRDVYKLMLATHRKLKGDKTLREELEGHRVRLGGARFLEVLGANGFESLEQLMTDATGQQTQAVLDELRAG